MCRQTDRQLKHKRFGNTKAFTLAEVLTVIFVLGVVAMETIPVLLASYTEKVTITRLKAAYSILSQATSMVQADCDGSLLACISDISAADNDADTVNEIAALYRPYLSLAKDCGINGTGCFAVDVYYKYLDDGLVSYKFDDNNIYYRFLLNNGTSLLINWNPTGDNRGYINLEVDLNYRGSPNQYGRDYFVFAYNHNTGRLEPMGVNFDEYGADCNVSAEGAACAAKVLREQAINY